MLFKDVKAGFPIYLYDRNTIEIKLAKVVSVSMPHLDSKRFDIGSKMVVDIVLEINGSTTTYTLYEDADTGYTDSAVITTDKQNIIREIEIAKSQSEEILSHVDMHKDRIEKYTRILADFNPAIREKQEINERFGKLEGSIDEIKAMLSNIVINPVS